MSLLLIWQSAAAPRSISLSILDGNARLRLPGLWKPPITGVKIVAMVQR